jgi:hypothetical protein
MELEEHDWFHDFLEERGAILEDIREFLRAVLLYCLDMEDNLDFKPNVIANENLVSLIESLCLIHGLYGYPALNANRARGNNDSPY